MAKGTGGAIALCCVLLASASADARTRHRAPRPLLIHTNLAADAPGFGAFTPAAADPRVAAEFARSGLGTGNFAGGAFRFTPSGTTPSRRAVTVAVRARMVTRSEAAKTLVLASDGLAPSAYSLGASVGWKRFALSGDVSKIDGGLLPTGRESADIGLSFSGKRWATKFDLGTERSDTDNPAMIGIDQSWSVGLGGSYSVTHNIDLTGGLRYKTQHDQLMSFLDNKRDSQAVYLGTTFKF
ncbi:hypothetical protein [Sphingomonas nostoxanthinifaciens]|uniref:hypothetical protein n=1 Tax=Sphingomonas nostoxanthinifaciens TaxID=2872652 RepID=UPI001CC20CD4|nr:hypothetical protein [Sphingomonas nostoxanthinifaciens]UAK24324.1 hypothetical protein K8P63_18760 [Sphingomonas nostoxanthinifaciens]